MPSHRIRMLCSGHHLQVKPSLSGQTTKIPYLWTGIPVSGWFPFHGVLPAHSSLAILVGAYSDVWTFQPKVRFQELPLPGMLATSFQVRAPHSQLFHELHQYLVQFHPRNAQIGRIQRTCRTIGSA